MKLEIDTDNITTLELEALAGYCDKRLMERKNQKQFIEITNKGGK